jgi:hypothetical protein
LHADIQTWLNTCLPCSIQCFESLSPNRTATLPPSPPHPWTSSRSDACKVRVSRLMSTYGVGNVELPDTARMSANSKINKKKTAAISMLEVKNFQLTIQQHKTVPLRQSSPQQLCYPSAQRTGTHCSHRTPVPQTSPLRLCNPPSLFPTHSPQPKPKGKRNEACYAFGHHNLNPYYLLLTPAQIMRVPALSDIINTSIYTSSYQLLYHLETMQQIHRPTQLPVPSSPVYRDNAADALGCQRRRQAAVLPALCGGVDAPQPKRCTGPHFSQFAYSVHLL